MKKFVLLTVGFTQPTPEIMESWNQRFKSIKETIVDQIGLSNGKKVTKKGITELPMDKDTITGYVVIKAENMNEAIKIAQMCPMVTSIKVYEVRSHE